MPLLVDLYAQYNSVSDWAALASAVDGAYLKYSDGSSGAIVAADDYAAHCREHQIPYGGYAYAEPGQPIAQADILLAQYRRLGGALAPVLDLESGGIPAAQRIPFARTFLERIHGSYPVAVLYASASWLATLTPDAWPYPWERTWAAAYGPDDGLRHALTGYTGRVDLHQYTSAGRIAGAAGAVDLSYTDNLAALLNTSAPHATFGGVSATEETEMDVPAGTNEHTELFVKGKTEWYLMSAFNDHVTVHQVVYNGPTPATAGPAYLPGGTSTDWVFDANRPGPIPIPAGAVQLTLRYSSDHSFTLAAV